MVGFRLPRYDALPDIPLYSDQVIEYIHTVLEPLSTEADMYITNTMINNYVKSKIMPAPVKKRYTKEHLCYILVISLMKRVLSIAEIDRGIQRILQENSFEASYLLFVDCFESSLQQVVRFFYDPSFQTDQNKQESLALTLEAICFAFSAKLVADYSYRLYVNKEEDK